MQTTATADHACQYQQLSHNGVLCSGFLQRYMCHGIAGFPILINSTAYVKDIIAIVKRVKTNSWIGIHKT